ncbi:MAG: hypothetical protein RL385_3704 [Pseudomonadota bacterium]|jgi:hypothetical protein
MEDVERSGASAGMAARVDEAEELALAALCAPFPPPSREIDLDAVGVAPRAVREEPTEVRPRPSSMPPMGITFPEPTIPPTLLEFPEPTIPPTVLGLSHVAVEMADTEGDSIIELPSREILVLRGAEFAIPQGPSDTFLRLTPLPPEAQLAPSQGAPPFSRAHQWVALSVVAVACGALGALLDRSGALEAGRSYLVAKKPAVVAPASAVATSLRSEPAASAAPVVTTQAVHVAPAPSNAEVEAYANFERVLTALTERNSTAYPALEVALLRARQRDTNDPHVRGCLAELWLRTGNLDGALAEAKEAMRLRPKRARYRVLYGDVLAALRRTDEAEEAYTRAQALDSKHRHVRDDLSGDLRAVGAL